MNPVWYFLLVFLVVAPTKAELVSEEFQKAFAKASCDFALDLIKTASKDPDENVLLSPSSISVLLAILQQGANHTTADQLEKVLRLSPEDSKIGYGHIIKSFKRENTNSTLEWGNRAYVVPGFELRESFLENIEQNFNATFEELGLNAEEAAAKINDWVRETTHDNIHDLVDASLLTSDVVMIMVNAIYFKSAWDSSFQICKTRNDKFQVSQDRKVEVPFMRQAGRIIAGEDTDLGVKWIELPFKDENFSMIFILPIKPNGLTQVMEKITGEDLTHIFSNQNTRRVELIIPKFKLSHKLSLVETLKELGLSDVFTIEADLSGVTKNEENLRVSELLHQADVEIDEDGGKAAAATLEKVQTLSLEWYELYFRADHPFLFFIVDKPNQVPVFAGKIVNPKNASPK